MMRLTALFLLLLPSLLVGNSQNMRAGFAGAPDGRDCASCHNSYGAANSDLRGSVSVDLVDYNPGTTPTIRVSVRHPEASVWGFQITVRPICTPGSSAGNFQAAANVAVVCGNGSAAPCISTTDFATHSIAPRTAPGLGFDFDIPWVSPSSDVGSLTVYISAVAADGDGKPTGDRVYDLVKTIALSPNAACPIRQKPTLRSAANAASFSQTFSPSSMVTVFGLGFQNPGQSRTVCSGDLVNNAFPTTFACVAVEMNGQRVPISYIKEDQINIQAPANLASGPVSLRVLANPDKPNQLPSDVATLTNEQAYSPAFFTFNGTSVAALFANSANIVANPAVVPGARPAKPGDVISLFGTGFGATSPAYAAGALAPGIANLTAPISISIGGITLGSGDIFYAGLSPGSITGLYQFNVRVPTGAADGDQPVIITVGGVQTQTGATIPVQH